MHKPQLKRHVGASAGLVFLVHASALKTLHKAGRRGGDSIAREHEYWLTMFVVIALSSVFSERNFYEICNRIH